MQDQDLQNPYQNFDDPSGGSAPTGAPGNWWEQPRPATWPANQPWPPPLAPGDTYGSAPGSVIKAPGSANSTFAPGTNVAPGADVPLAGTKATPVDTNPGAPGPTTTDPGTTLGSLLAPYPNTFQAPPMLNLGGAPGLSYIPPPPTLSLPGFQKSPAWSYADFQLPSADQVLANDPGEAFRLKLGTDTITNNAAAQGTVRGGATLQNLVKFGQDYGTSEYGAAADRAFNTYSANRANSLGMYNTNYQTQYVDPYNFNVQAAKDMFAPQEANFKTIAAAGQRQNEDTFSQGLDAFNTNFNVFKYNQQWPYTVLSDQQRLGLQAAGA